ncbi:MAG TPA: dTDP-4-dehydrorhamnose reductase [Thiobacillaceae bacterium]|nr:dTDP-4-dehydrorhamnose reductase [Thiobacillaceae bacterium]HNU64214.1 dTDP-4-dehydrorhamnose reductase [Thiobacillaceae bacterium]
MNAPPTRILLTGANGQVGWELHRTLATLGQVVAMDSRAMDLADPDAIRRALAEVRPRLIVNPAAYTAVDQAEREPDLARKVNAEAPGILAEAAAKSGALLVHYSTDYVFGGGGISPWKENDPTAPVNVYGATKLAGEQAIIASGCHHLIFRTSWVYGARGTNFLLTMRRLVRERPELKIVDDQVGAPTWCRGLAEATAQVLAQLASPLRGADRPEPWGVYHMTNAGETSWYGFAQAILDWEGLAAPPRLLPIPSTDYPTPAHRPLNSRLDNGKLARVFGLRLPPWRDALKLCLDKAE